MHNTFLIMYCFRVHISTDNYFSYLYLNGKITDHNEMPLLFRIYILQQFSIKLFRPMFIICLDRNDGRIVFIFFIKYPIREFY